MKHIYLVLTLCLLWFAASSQNFPEELRISADGQRLVLGGSAAQGLYDESAVKTIELTFDDADFWSKLSDDQLATLVYEGVTYDSVGVRFKGATSDFRNDTQKKSFNISLDFVKESQDIQGYQTLNLNGGFEDPSHMREVIYNWTGRHYNASLKSNFVHLVINGESWGAYNNVQQLNKDYLREWFEDEDGSRFRCVDPNAQQGGGPGGGGPGGGGPGGGGPGGGGPGQCNGGMGGGPGGPGGGGDGWGGGPSSLNWLGTDTTEYQENYTLKNDDQPDAWTDLIHRIDKLNSLPLDQLADSLGNYYDMDKTLWFLAHEAMLTDQDGYLYKGMMDYYVYVDPMSDRLVPLEYDGNSAMVNSLLNWSPFHREDDECFPLMNRVMQVPEFRQRYLAHCRTVINKYFTVEAMSDRMDFYDNLINQYEADDPIGDQLFSYQQYQNGVQELKDFVSQRRNILLANSEIQAVPLVVSEVTESMSTPTADDSVIITAIITDGNAAGANLYYGTGITGRFFRVAMNDQGVEGDVMSGDGIYAATIPAQNPGAFVRYYIEAIKDDSAGTRVYEPAGAEHEVYFYRVSLNQAQANPVVINELMASNETTVADQDGEFDDWIELFNTSSDVVDLGGYYLTDNDQNLTKYEIPAGTTIGGRDYLIIWADENGMEEGLHANFKLAKGGETVYLLTPDLAIMDMVVFGEQQTDLAYARQPNGTGDFVIKTATFEDNNDLTSNVEETLEETFSIYPNPSRSVVNIKTKTILDQPLAIYNMMGQTLYKEVAEKNTVIDVSKWERGVYFVNYGRVTNKLILQ